MLYFCVQKVKVKAVKQRSAPPIFVFFGGHGARKQTAMQIQLKEDSNQNSKRLLLVAISYLWLIYSKLYHIRTFVS